MRTFRWSSLVVVALIVAGCATGRAIRQGEAAARRGDWDAAVAYYRQALVADPGRIDIKIALERSAREAAAQHIGRARALEAQEQWSGAAAEYRLAADLEPSNTLAVTKAVEIERRIRAEIEAARPRPRIDDLRQQAAQSSTVPRLDPRVTVPGLRFSNTAVRDILASIGAVTGINITWDQQMAGADQRAYSLDVSGASLEDVLNQVMAANGLTFKVTNQKTIFVYVDNATNRQKYEDQFTQTFYLSHADAAEVVQLLNQMVQTGPAVRPVITQNKSTNAIVARATAPVMAVIDSLIRSADKPRAEVLVDVQILEVSRIRMRQLGLDLNQYALGFTLSPEVAPPNTAGTIPGANAPPFNLNTISQGVSAADFYATVPGAQIKLLEQDTSTRLLAKPQLRGREGATLTMNLGDSIPVPQTTFGAAAPGGVATVPQTSYQYRPVGVNLQITPRVTYQDEIILDPITVDKSGIGPNVEVAGQSLPTFIQRSASVSMRLRDGESNLLAGLIREEDRRTIEGLPGINRIPLLRSLFGNSESNRDQSDIVMIVTPHIVRSRELTAEDLKPLYIGTNQNFGAGSTPTLISPGAPPPDLTVATGVGRAGGAAPVPPAAAPAPAAGVAAPPPAGAAGAAGAAPPAGATPPPAGAELPPTPPPGAARAPGVVPIQPVAPGAPPPAPLSTVIDLTTPGSEFQVGGPPYTIPVRVSNVSQLGSVTLSITYDPKLLRIVAVNQGTFLQQGGVAPTFVPKIDAAAGRIDIAMARAGDRPGASGTGLLAALTVEAIGAGQTRLSLTAVAASDKGAAITVQAVSAAVTIR
jgi:general secretion pathway protein D